MDFLSYVHDFSPWIVRIGEAMGVRWYGLAYLLGFFAGFFVLRSLARRGLWNLSPDKVADFVTYVAIFGVMLGARVGYILFYYVRNRGWSALLDDPLVMFKVWEGGMASHGGLIGVVVFVLYYSWRHKLSALGLLDGLAIVAPIGLFFGRMANFINGELYGRVTSGIAWAMKFPMEMEANRSLANDVLMRLHAEKSPLVPNFPNEATSADIRILLEANQAGDPLVKKTLEEFLPDRHPSQLYEAFAEGLLIFVVLYWIRVKFPQAREGLFSGLFCLLYAGGRITVEYFREPDASLVGPFTMGQFLSLFMVIVGVGLLVYSWKSKPRGASEGKK